MVHTLHILLFTALFGVNLCIANVASINHPNITLRENVALSASMLSQKQESLREKVTRKFPLSPLVHSPRILAFYEDLHDSTKHCGEFASNHDWRPTFRGNTAICMFNAPKDPVNSFFLDHGQRTQIKDYIVSNLISTLKTDILLYSTKGTSKPIDLNTHDICKLFKIPESHKTNGLNDVDIAFYVAAGPQKYTEHTPAWADVCPTSKDQPIVIALNINAQMIRQSNILESVIQTVRSALKIPKCNGNGNLLLTRNDTGGIQEQNECISVNCAEQNEANKKVKYWNNNDWKECSNGANCLSFDDICKNWIDKKFTQTLTFSNSLTHSETITSSITETITQTDTSSLTNTFTQTIGPTPTKTFSSSLSATSSLPKLTQKKSKINKDKADEKMKSIDKTSESSHDKVKDMSRKGEENALSENIVEQSLQDRISEHNLTKNEEGVIKRKENQVSVDSCSTLSYICAVSMFALLFGIFTFN